MAEGAVRLALLLAWAGAGAALVARGRADRQPVGFLVLGGTAVAAVGAYVDAAAPIVVAFLPPIALHVSLSLPDGRLRTAVRRTIALLGYAAGAAVAAASWTSRPGVATAPVVAEAIAIGVVGLVTLSGGVTSGSLVEQHRRKFVLWGLLVTGGLVAVVFGLHALVSWPDAVPEFAAAVTLPIPLALAASASRRAAASIDALLVRTFEVAGLAVVIGAVYLAVVLGLGRLPRQGERTILVLSMVAAAIAALLAFPVRARLAALANRLVYRERHAPDEAIRQFGSRLTRALPLDELLLQAAESLRLTLALVSAEVWTLSGDTLHLAVSDPDRPHDALPLGPAETQTVARAGVSGTAWTKVWLPGLLDGRPEDVLRVAPIVHSSELLGAIVVARAPGANRFAPDEERTLAELARQMGLTLHNVRLDSALQASLDEVRRQARELQASRGRIVAAADAARRGIERNLHDGAQQHLVALAVKIGLAKQFVGRDPDRAVGLLEDLSHDVEDTLQELRDLAHGIYPPVLADRGLADALASAARRATVPTEVDAAGIGRYPPEQEAAVYFCCLEALQNAGKYAGEGAGAAIGVREESGALVFHVEDDGAGFDVGRRGVGAGFTNMNDRLGAVGGTLRVESSPGRGTRVTGVIPLSSAGPAA